MCALACRYLHKSELSFLLLPRSEIIEQGRGEEPVLYIAVIVDPAYERMLIFQRTGGIVMHSQDPVRTIHVDDMIFPFCYIHLRIKSVAAIAQCKVCTIQCKIPPVIISQVQG